VDGLERGREDGGWRSDVPAARRSSARGNRGGIGGVGDEMVRGGSGLGRRQHMSSSGVLRVSDAASLAMHCAAVLAAHKGEVIPARRIADRLHASEAHLAKVLQRLGKAGIVRSERGPSGGFSLAVPPRKLSLLRVYEAIDGPLATKGCLLGTPVCNRGDCILGGALSTVGDLVRERLARTTVADMAELFGDTGE